MTDSLSHTGSETAAPFSNETQLNTQGIAAGVGVSAIKPIDLLAFVVIQQAASQVRSSII
jgi:hypothetical protein